MSKYSIAISETAAAFLASQTRKVQRQIARKIDALQNNPHPPGSAPIKGASEFYRIRSGDYRIIYTIKKHRLTILVVHIGRRKDVHKHLR